MHLSVVAPVAPVRHSLMPILERASPPPPLEPPVAELSDAELVAELIRQGASLREARLRAQLLLDTTGGLRGLAHAGHLQLESAGLTEETIRALKASLSLGARLASAEPPCEAMDAAATVALFRPLLLQLQHEELHVLFLDAQGRYRGRRRLSSGGSASCSLYARDVLAAVVEARATSFALVHNHPSGRCAPSPEDASLSTRVMAAADLIGVRLVDHLVVAEDGSSSAMPDGPRWPATRRVHSRIM